MTKEFWEAEAVRMVAGPERIVCATVLKDKGILDTTGLPHEHVRVETVTADMQEWTLGNRLAMEILLLANESQEPAYRKHEDDLRYNYLPHHPFRVFWAYIPEVKTFFIWRASESEIQKFFLGHLNVLRREANRTTR